MKESIESVYAKIGGDQNFAEWAQANQTEYYKIYAKLIPRDINLSGANGGELIVNLVKYTSHIPPNPLPNAQNRGNNAAD